MYDTETKKCRNSKKATKAPASPTSPKAKPKTIAQIRAECKEKGLVYDTETKKCRHDKRGIKVVQVVKSSKDDCVDLSVSGKTASIRQKYSARSSPPYSASDCPGSIKQGNNGEQYISVQNSAGVWTWRKHVGSIKAVGPGIPEDFIQLAEDCEAFKAWKRGKVIGHGTYGAIYIACRAGKPKECDYVLKVQKDDHEFREEIKALNGLKDVDVAVTMYAAWTCDGMGYIVLESLEKCDATYESVREVLDKLEDLGWIHADSHSGNFMCRKDGTLVVIDFGWAIKKGKKTYPQHHWSKQIGYNLTYDDIKFFQDRIVANEFLPEDNPIVLKINAQFSKKVKEIIKR